MTTYTISPSGNKSIKFVNILVFSIVLAHSGSGIKAFAQYSSEFKPSSFSENKEVVLVAWNSPEGRKRLKRTKYNSDFYQLASFYQPQINPLYCGIATSTIILNYIYSERNELPDQKQLEVNRPELYGGGKIPFRSFSQITLLNDKTESVKSREIINLENFNSGDSSSISPGLTLDELNGILGVYGLKTTVFHAESDIVSGIDNFRNMVMDIMMNDDVFLVVNFVGNLIGATTGGHISPVVAYDKKSDSVLILDVAGHKNPWYWAPVYDLYNSMHTKDSGNWRGWIVISEN